MSWDNTTELYLFEKENETCAKMQPTHAGCLVRPCWDGDDEILNQIEILEKFCKNVRKTVKKHPGKTVLRTNQ